MAFRFFSVVFLCLSVVTTAYALPPASQPAGPSALAAIRDQAEAHAPNLKSNLARQFGRLSSELPSVAPNRVMYKHETTKTWHSPAQRDKLDESARKSLSEVPIDDKLYYNTKYGTPIAYARPLDLMAEAGLSNIAGRRILDFGYGGIGHLRLLALMGADAVGVDVDPFLVALYSAPADQGAVVAPGGRKGALKLVHGQWPADKKSEADVGDGFDIIISKNTLKNGYLHPEKPVDPRRLVQLGVSDNVFVRKVHDALKPGGFFMIYNLCPAPAPPDKPYIPWADGRCPFPRDMLEKAGFEIIAFDRNDDAAAREMARALGWDQGGMDVEKDLFGIYTLARRPAA